MNQRLRLDLHLDAFGLAVGGGYTLYDGDGRRRAAGVVVTFEKDAIEAADACRQLMMFAQEDPNWVRQLRLW